MIELDPRDAVRALAAAYDGSLLNDDHDLEDLFGAGVIRTVRDITDEYVTQLTPEGSQAIYALLERLNPEGDESRVEYRIALADRGDGNHDHSPICDVRPTDREVAIFKGASPGPPYDRAWIEKRTVTEWRADG